MGEEGMGRRRMLSCLSLAMLCISLVMMAMPERERLLVYAILWPLTVAALLLLTISVPKKATPVIWIGLAMSLWTLVCNVINGDTYLQLNLRYVYGIALAFGLGLCLFPVISENWEKWLPAFLLVFALYTLAMAAISCYACLRDRLIQLPFAEGTIGITFYRLYAFNKHPNEIGCMLVMGLLCWMVLALRSNRWYKRILCLLLLLPICFAISLTVSRTTITLAALALGGFSLVVLTKKHTLLRWGAGLVVLAVIFAGSLWVMMTGIPQMLPKAVNPAPVEQKTAQVTEQIQEQPVETQLTYNNQHIWQRSYTDGIGTFSMRTEIWQAGLQYLKDRPITLLIGSTDGVIARIPGQLLGRPEYHMHNAWLEVLLQAGIPGLLMMAAVFLRMYFAAARLFFGKHTAGWMRVLAAAPVLMSACTLMETYPAVSANVYDMMMMLLCGAVITADIQCASKWCMQV
ncbi:MAG: O-antigen ligase family protein [Clostridia bacterium]|nr:O-antigen ligase family protein [Clostridia bacterium]